MDGISYHLTMDMNGSSLCQDCGLVFTEKWMLKEHKRVAHDERVIKCDYCNVEIIGLMKMKAHKQKHKQKECKRCSLLVFANSWSSHQSKCSETKLKCKLCSFEHYETIINKFKCKFDKLYESLRRSCPINLKKKSFVNRFLFDNLIE